MSKKIDNHYGFTLLEAILSVVVVSLCLTFIAQSLLTNFRTGVRFQETVRTLLAMENRLGLLYASNASVDLLQASPQPLERPYDKFSASARSDVINDHLTLVGLTINQLSSQNKNHLDVTTIIYNPNETQSTS